MDLGFVNYLQFFFALVFVLGLIGLLALAARRMGFGYRLPSRGRRARRLALVEVMPLDSRRRLALVRRDSVEYLLLLGANTDLLLDGGLATPSGDFDTLLTTTVNAADKPDASQ